MGNLEKLEKLSWRSKISFGIGAFGKDLVYALVGNLFMFYLTDVRFVAPVFVGTLFMVARICFGIFLHRPLFHDGTTPSRHLKGCVEQIAPFLTVEL